MSRMSWVLNRLRAMGPMEMLWRSRQALKARVERRGWGLATHPPMPEMPWGRPWCDPVACGVDVELYVLAAERILAGQYDVFALRDVYLGFPPEWNRDPLTGIRVGAAFGKTLDHRDERVVGNIKYLWEPNRHLELATLAQAFHLTGETKYATGCRTLLESWFDQCPYPLGPNWTSSLEHGVRLVNWAFAWQLLVRRSAGSGTAIAVFEGEHGQAFQRRWLDSIYQHCRFIAGHLSRYSSANNHLLGEYMGLLVGALTWPSWPDSAYWKQMALQGFESEALLQNASDGVNREQAIYYQHEVMDMMLICGLICRANSIAFSAAYWERLERMMEFVTALMDRSGNIPMIGDADDALVMALSREPGWSPYRSLLATGAVLFERGDFKTKAGRFDDKSRWLLGDAAADHFAALVQSDIERPRRAFAEGGYYILGARFGEPTEVRAVVDCGPLGYLNIAAHGHADALSFLLSAGGQQLLVDPGTYAFHTQRKWRDYFRGTYAHNTLRVDAVDQSVIGGRFLWLHHAHAHCEVAELNGRRQVFRGWHDGYRRLRDPVTHRREIIFDVETNCFEVVDTIECDAQHDVELCWHFSDDCVVNGDERSVNVTSGPVLLTMMMTCNTLSLALLRGQAVPPAGWLSHTFDVKRSTTSAVWRGRISSSATWRTRLHLAFVG